MKSVYFSFLLLIMVVLSGCIEKGSVTASDAYAFATSPVQRHGAAFLTIKNTTSDEVQIVSARSDVTGRVEMHSNGMDGDTMMMRELEAIVIAPKTTHVLEPAGDHIMLMDLPQPLRKGDHFDLILSTKAHGDLTVKVDIVAPGDIPSPSMGH